MKEIKFRAWVNNNRMGVTFNPFDPVIMSQGGTFPDGTIFMQYTGFKDKNGKEIYEGDVVATRVDTRGEVVFYNGAWRVKRGNYKPTPIPAYTWKEVFEVIGNIYENPELLKK